MGNSEIDDICKEVFESRSVKESIMSACQKHSISTATFDKWKAKQVE